MPDALTLPGSGFKRAWSFLAGAGMMTASAMTIGHFYAANFPASIFEGSFCDISAFFNCDASAFSSLAHFGGVPMGWFGLLVGVLVVLGAIFPSAAFERTNMAVALANALGALALFVYSAFILGSVCLLCLGYYLFSLLSFFLFWRFGLRSGKRGFLGFLGTFVAPSPRIAIVALAALAAGAFGFREFTGAKAAAQTGGEAARIVEEFLDLEIVGDPSFISPYWAVQGTPEWEDAPIRIVEYADYLCPDCLFLHQQLSRMKAEYAGKMNVAFQIFPLENGCNDVVEKDLHPGACDLSLIALHDPSLFPALHEEIYANFQNAKRPEWREDLMRRYGLEAALTDPGTREMLQRIIATGTEYAKTSERYSHGIRSTPTMIINGRMIIGTLPDAHLKAIFDSILEEAGEGVGSGRFLENWVDLKSAPVKKTPQP